MKSHEASKQRSKSGMNTQDRITATTTDTSRCGLNRTMGRLATVAAFAAAALHTATARADDPYI